MAQYLPLPDGNSLLMKEGETPQEAYARAQRQFPDSFKVKEPEKKEVTVGGQAKEFFKGLAPGAIGLVEQAGVGISALLPEEQEKAAQKSIKETAASLKKPFEAAPGYEDTVARKFGEATGSIAPFLAAGPFGLAGRGIMAALGSGAGAGYQVEKSAAEGATEGQQTASTALGAAVGISEMFAPARILSRLGQPVAQGVISYIKRALMAGGEEAAQEAASQAAQNLISKGIYKAEQEIIEGVGESAAYGGGVGALAQGLLDLALGRRAKGAGTPQQEEFAALRAEEEKRLEEERKRKTTPEYAQEVVQKYDVLAKQKQDLIAQIKKIEKGSPTVDADRAFNRDLNAQIKELSKELEPLADDYYKAKGMLGQMAEQERVAKLTPQEYAFGLEPETEEQKKALEPELYEQQIAKPPKPPVQLTPRQQVAEYGNQRIALANDQMNTAASYAPKYKNEALKEYADYLLQDFASAQQLVQTRPTLEGLPMTKDNKPLLRSEEIYDYLNTRIAAEAKTAMQQRSQEQALDQQKLTTPKDQFALLRASEEQVEEQKRTAEPNFDYLDPMFEKALSGQPGAVKVNENLRPLREAPTVRKTVDQLFDVVEQADRDYRALRRQGNRDAAMDAFQRLNTANDQLNAMAKEQPAGTDTKGLKRGPAEEDTRASYARELIAARRAQQEAMAKLEDATSDVRSQLTLGKETEQVRNPETGEMETRLVGFGKGVAETTEASLVKKAEEARAQYIIGALQEAAINRRALNRPALTTDEALTAASKLHDTFNNWIERAKEKGAAPVYEDVIIEPAQMRADKIVRSAVTERRLVSGGVKKLSEAEIKHFRAIINAARNKLTDEAQRKVEKVEAKPLNVQFASEEAKKTAEARGETATTLGGELRRRTEFVRNKMSKMERMRPGARDALNAAVDIMDAGKATRELLDKVEPVVDAIVAGRDVKQVDIQAIKDAIRATETVPEGQKSLFPEIEKDLGYIRATPKNFAKSPRMKPVWEALDKARALFKKSEQQRLAKKATVAKRMQFLERVKERGDSIIADTQYFWKDTSRYSDAALAKVFVGMPEAGKTPEEKVILEKYRTLQPMSAQEQQTAERLVREFKTEHLPKYRKEIDEAMQMLADGRRLDDTDNQLLSFMQDTNVNVRAAAKALNDRLQPLRTAIKQVKEAMRKSSIIDPAQKAILDSERAVKQQRSQYQTVVEESIKRARREMDEALGFLLEPVIAKTSDNLKAAEATLAKEQAELDKIKKRFDDVLAQKDGANRTELATYELFRYEEKKSVIDDLKKQIDAQETELQDLVNELATDYDGGYAVAQAMLDSNVKFERQYLEMLEGSLANMRGESVLDRPGSYPFAYQQAKKNADAQRATLKAAEKRATEFKEVAKSDQQQMQEFWKDKLGGEGIESKRRAFVPEERKEYEALDKKIESLQEKYDVARDKLLKVRGKAKTALQEDINTLKADLDAAVERRSVLLRDAMQVSKIATTAEKEAERLRKEASEALEREEDAFARTARKEQIFKTYGDQIADLLFEAEGIPGPNTEAELKKIINDPKSEFQDVINAQAKVGVLQTIASIEAQADVLIEGKPKRKQSAATTLSSTGQAKGKPLRAGTLSEKSIERLFKPEPAKTIVDRFDFGSIDREEADIGRAGEGKTQGSFDFGGDFNFSRGESTTGTDAKTLKAELDEAMGTDVTARGNVKIYNSVEAFIKENPKYANKIPSDAKGFAENERAVLFANNIGRGHGLGVLLHEIGVHVGFRNFFNETQFNRLADTVKGWAKRTDNSIEAQIGRKAMQRVEMAETPAKQVNDELLAYAVEEAVQAGVLGTKKGSAYGWLSSIIDAFKKALNKLGIPTSEITAGDLVNFAHGCAQLELRGTWHGTGGIFDVFDFAFMGTGEGFQAFSWGTYRAQKIGVAKHYREIGKNNQMKAWNKLPEIVEWRKTQEPNFNGFFADDYLEFAQNPKLEGTKLGGIPHEYAMDFSMLLSFMDPNTDDFYFHSISRHSPFKRLNDAIARFENGIDEGLLPLDDDVKQFVQNIDIAKLNIPFNAPVYRGMDWYDVTYQIDDNKETTTPVQLAADKVLWVLRQSDTTYGSINTSADTFEKQLDDAIAFVKKDQETNIFLFKDTPDEPLYKSSKVALEGIKQLNKSDFTYNPLTPPPLPEPTGVMMRTLHTRPEDTYLLWDSPLSKQPAPVNEAFKNILRDMRPDARQQFDRMMTPVYAVPAGRPRAATKVEEPTGSSFYHALKLLSGSKRLASEVLASYGVSGNKFLDHDSRDRPVTNKSTYNYVDYVDKEEGADIIATDLEPIGKAKGILLSRKPQFADPEFERVSSTVTRTVAQDKTWWDSIKANLTGLAFETQLVDRFAGFERLAKYMEPLKGTQMLYYLRSYDQRMNIVSKAVSDGAPSIREIKRDDGRVERLVETTGGASIAGVVNKLKEANQYIGNGEAVNQVFTTYMAAIRAKNKGIETLNFGKDKDGKPVLTQEMLDEVTALVEKNKPLEKIFNEARTEYNKYNRDLLDFVASTGALSKALVKKLVAEDDYIPFYRERKGVVELVIGNESPIRIGSIADQPYLDKLVGGDTAIIDFMNSSVQNTNMLVDMGMRNLATKNAVMELVDLKAATLVKKADGTDVVKFKVDGDDRYAIVATEKVMIGNKEFETGVPADILVKGMEGIPTQMPFLFRVMAMPAQLLRKAITLSPLYMAKQLFRDSLAAPILSGADFVPVLGVLREVRGAAKEKLEKRGIVGGQYFRGTSEDLSMILREISDGQPGWMKALGRFEAMGMEADALTRRAQYNSYIEQGLSEMEATLMALESMNFNKRGASPSVHVANALIPFFNAQIQGLNVMYKAMSGKMPFNDQLRIREKMLQRGGMMAAATFAYAVMMEDDEAYKNATPDQKYGNWFIRLPGLDEPVKVPVPFEIGYIFKAIPEALYNSMTTEHGGEEAVKAFKQILLQTIPGGSSYGIPQAAKPLIEVGLGKSFYTGRDILSAREKELLPEQQYRVNTSEAAKLVGSTLGISPIKIEALVSGYTGTMGLAFLQAISLGVPAKETPERAVRRLSEYPILGGAFQPNDAGGIINSVYERMNEISQVKNTVDNLLKEGKVQEAEALITKRGTEYMQSELSNTFKANMNMLTQAERAVAASNMTPEAKRKQLDEIRKMKIAIANTTREISDKTIRLIGGS
jgi:hypothetical protein